MVAKPTAIKANKARQRELDWEDTRRPAWVAWLGMACAIVLFVAMVIMAQSDRTSKPMNINGDQLGPFYMSDEAYVKHADQLLRETNGAQPRWALVSPTKELGPKAMAEALSVEHPEQLRVGTLLAGAARQLAIPEPAAGLRRVDVFRLASKKLDGKPAVFNGALVRAAPRELRELAQNPAIRAVEPAPVDAVYGRIGVRSMTPISSEKGNK